MDWLFLLIAYLPVASLLIGLAFLGAGFLLRKSRRRLSKRLYIAGGFCASLCLLIFAALFLVGALGIGPIPT